MRGGALVMAEQRGATRGRQREIADSLRMGHPACGVIQDRDLNAAGYPTRDTVGPRRRLSWRGRHRPLAHDKRKLTPVMREASSGTAKQWARWHRPGGERRWIYRAI